jgi:hypothetical protein
MTRLNAFLAILFAASLFNATASKCFSLPPIQTLNFDFGGGSAYVGDDGILSSPGGTYWNAISADDITGCCFDDFSFDEFGQLSPAFVFSVFPNWTNSSSPSNQGPRSDAIQPAGPGFTTLTIGRVNEFHEMIIYVNSPIGYYAPSSPGGGFSFGTFDPTVVVPFSYASGAGTGFPGFPPIPTLNIGREFLHITTPPPRGSGLGESPTITIVLEDPYSTIAAIQIRGRFAGAPEPSSVVLLLLGSSVGFLRRIGSRF